MRRTIFATTVGVLLLNSTAALAADSASSPNDDPWERMNRGFYSFNQGLDRAIIRPAAMVYSHVLPSPLRTGIRHLLSNATEPATIINDILQVRFKRAGKATGRFLLNTTVGVAGLFDVASGAGLEHEGNSFAFTLARYGVKTGPYLYLPVVGPTTVRGVAGAAVGGALDPLYWLRYPHKTEVSFGRALATGLDLRAESDSTLRSLTSDATDPYATIRSAYLQNLQSQVSGENAPVQSLPDFEDVAPPAPPPPAPAPAPSGDQPTAKPQTPPAQPSPDASPPAPAPASATTAAAAP